jgi:hypothetical protein
MPCLRSPLCLPPYALAPPNWNGTRSPFVIRLAALVHCRTIEVLLPLTSSASLVGSLRSHTLAADHMLPQERAAVLTLAVLWLTAKKLNTSRAGWDLLVNTSRAGQAGKVWQEQRASRCGHAWDGRRTLGRSSGGKQPARPLFQCHDHCAQSARSTGAGDKLRLQGEGQRTAWLWSGNYGM